MMSRLPFYLGTYTERLPHTEGSGPGIVPCSLNPKTGQLRIEGKPTPIRNPSYLWLDQPRSRLYAVSEICDFEEQADGCLTVFKIPSNLADPLTPLQATSSLGAGPAYCRGDNSENFLLNANFVGSSWQSYPINKDGTLSTAAVTTKLQGKGAHPRRQASPHPHCIQTTPDNRHIIVADLGTDALLVYRFDVRTNSISFDPEASLQLPPASGPRHFVFHPNGKTLYLGLELSSQIAGIAIDPQTSKLALTHLLSSFPQNAVSAPESHPSEILLSRTGSHLYIANRGIDQISGYALDPSGTEISLINTWPIEGKTPRHIALSPDEKFLLVANQDSNQVTSFQRDPITGELQSCQQSLPIGSPNFIAFL